MTEFSKTFLVFYKWPDLTDVQVVLTTSTVAYWVFAAATAVPGRSRAKYFVDEVLEKIENIVINITYHKLIMRPARAHILSTYICRTS